MGLMLAVSGLLQWSVWKNSPELHRKPRPKPAPTNSYIGETRIPAEVDQIRFDDPELLGTRFRRLHDSAERFAGEHWSREPLAMVHRISSKDLSFDARWATASEQARIRHGEPLRPGQSVQLTARLRAPEFEKVHAVSILSVNVERSGWIATLEYGCAADSGKSTESLDLSLRFRDPITHGPERYFRIPYGAISAYVGDDSDKRAYTARVSNLTNRPTSRIRAAAGELSLAFLTSEDEFREAVLDEFHQLEEIATRSFEDGTIEIQTADYRHVNGKNPPMWRHVSTQTDVPTEIRQQLRDRLLRIVVDQRAFAESQIREMFLAVRNGFPLWEALTSPNPGL